jgi:molybdate transport system substrate-binding protein
MIAMMRHVSCGIALALAFALPSEAAQIRVMLSGGFAAAYEELVQDFTRQTGHKVETARGPSMGETPQAIPNRMARGEPVDVVIMVREALDGLAARGKVTPDTRVDLANSRIAMAVKSGGPRPDISTMEAFRKTVLDAKSIAYSDSASGVYLSTVLFPRMGISDAIKGRARMIPAEPVGKVVARGEAEIGFQQLSELKHVGAGIDIVGFIPAEAQKITVFSAGLAASAPESKAGWQLIEFLSSKAAYATIAKTGLDPIEK